MTKKIRIIDIAKKADVSTGTVDRVIHNRGRVSKDVLARVQSVIEELNYKPNIIARTLQANRTNKFVAIIPDPLIDPFWEASIQGIENAKHDLSQYNVVVEQFIYNPYNKSSFLDAITNSLEGNFQGFLLAPIFHKESIEAMRQWERLNIPYILINTKLSGITPLSFIGQDLYQSGLLAGKLVHYGVKKGGTVIIAHINEDAPNSLHLLNKQEGFIDYFSQENLQLDYEIVKVWLSNPNSNSFTLELNELRKNYPNLQAIFVTNSKAYEIAFYLEERGVTDIVLVGYDLLPKNLHYLKRNIIQFLINQNSIGQAYQGIKRLADHVLFKYKIEPIIYLHLDIITKENMMHYLQSE